MLTGLDGPHSPTKESIMANLGLGTECPRCKEAHLLVELELSTVSPFTTDTLKFIGCSRCLDEFVSNEKSRVHPDIAMIPPWSDNGTYFTLYDWIQDHV